MAREASSWLDSEAEDEIDDLWTRCSSATDGEDAQPSASKIGWRAKQEKLWIDRLERADRPKQKKRKKSTSSPQFLLPKRKPPTGAVNTSSVGEALQAVCAIQPAIVSGQSVLSVSKSSLDSPANLPSVPWRRPLPVSTALQTACPPTYLWTVFPRQAIRTHCLTYDGRISSLSALLHQAGRTHVSDSSVAITDGTIYGRARETVVFTTPGQELALASELRQQWRKCSGSAAVAVCSVNALTSICKPLNSLAELVEHIHWL